MDKFERKGECPADYAGSSIVIECIQEPALSLLISIKNIAIQMITPEIPVIKSIPTGVARAINARMIKAKQTDTDAQMVIFMPFTTFPSFSLGRSLTSST